MNVKLKRINGILKVDIDGKIYEPLSFKSFRPTDRNISDFYKAGVRLFSVLTSSINCMLGIPYSLFEESWIDDGQYDFSGIDKQMELFLKNAPDGYFAVMLDCNTREWYYKKHNIPHSFTHLSQMCADEKWRNDTKDYLDAVVNHIEEKYGNRVYGYFLLGGMTTEWFSHFDHMASHPIKEMAYKRYCKDENAVIPSQKELTHDSTQVFYDKSENNVLKYHEFHNKLIADTILFFASAVKKTIERKKLVGVYYGYLFELGGARLFDDGSLEYMRVFDSPDIDMISSPSSYCYRKHIDPSAFMVTYNSLDKRDKLYYLEFDHRTHLAPKIVPGSTIPFPGANDGLKNEDEDIDVMRRDFALTLANGAALWWFDMFEGWFYSDTMMNTIKQMIDISKGLNDIPMTSNAEIAVFASGTSLYGVNKESGINDDLLGFQRRGLSYLGAPYEVYDTSDIDKVDLSPYKLIVFEDALSLTNSEIDAINKKCKTDGKTILWCYAPAYFSGGEKEMKRLTDIDVNLYGGDSFTATAFNSKYGFTKRYTPMFWSCDGEIIGTYNGEGANKGALVRKKCDGYISVFSFLGNIPSNVLRQLASDAGVHIYSDSDNPVYVNSRLIGVCASHTGEVTINLTNDSTLDGLFSGEQITTKNNSFTITMREGEVRLYKIQ